MAECIRNRRDRAGQVSSEMSAEDVLRLLGSPDFVKQPFYEDDTRRRWTEEIWEYDFLIGSKWVTWRLTWKERTIASIKEVDPYWLRSDEREQEYLRF